MNATVNVVCYTSKILSNGEHPLMLRICKDGKKKYQSLGISINPKYWDFKKNTLKACCPNKEYIQKIILNKQMEFQQRMLQLTCEHGAVSPTFTTNVTLRLYFHRNIHKLNL